MATEAPQISAKQRKAEKRALAKLQNKQKAADKNSGQATAQQDGKQTKTSNEPKGNLKKETGIKTENKHQATVREYIEK